ncbi:MAG: lipopolysaccharide assembly protein LapB [Gammaproteobacteria bacterium]|nr:lipopolysaccharide assembly protein LapB [Gammaproteobacteria bacterium]
MPELYWLLLLLAGLAGWYLAYIFYHQKSKPKIPGEYLRGLNYLLNEQPDKALEVFIELVDVDTETVETHLAIGNMFRRRGEVDRAIRIHQNLVERPALSSTHRSTALLELAKDYLKAGLLDRAESLFTDVIRIGLQKREAYPLLLGLYEQEKEWDKAIETAKALEQVNNEDMNPMIAHYCCELSEQAFDQESDEGEAAGKLAKKALSYDRHCARANVLLGNYAMHEKDYKAATRHYKSVAKQTPEYLPEIFAKLHEAFLSQDDAEGFRQFLLKIKDSKLSGIVMSSLLTDLSDGEVGKNEILELLLEKPELSLLEVNAFLKNVPLQNESFREQISDRIQTSIENFVSQHNSHQCTQCGFHCRRLYWQCPSCHYWGTVIPVVPGLD